MPLQDPWVTLTRQTVGPFLTAAGLAGWVLAKNDRPEEAAATRELQDALDAALCSGVDEVRVSRGTVEGAASLWELAAALLESWSDSVGGDREAYRGAARLRHRVLGLRRALEAP